MFDIQSFLREKTYRTVFHLCIEKQATMTNRTGNPFFSNIFYQFYQVFV